jgi:electron transfer flavoprotein alpha subunit
VGGTITKDIWVFGDLRSERLFGFSLNVLAKARELSRTVGGRAVVVCLGQLEDTSTDVPLLLLFPLTDFGREIAARTARIRNGGLIADCADLRVDEGEIVGTCPAWGGQIVAEITFSDPSVTGFATVHPHVCPPADVPGEPGTVERITVERVHETKGPNLLSRSQEPAEGRMLEDAATVVVGGAGLGNMEGFGLVRELAAAVGGEVAATRPPALQHWVDEERMIGQTGKTVRPNLLFSIGTSGAIQYTAGITEAKTIVAINRDPSAPIFQVADFGVVADAKTFVPLLTARAKKAVMRKLADALTHDKKAEGSPGMVV